jgi:hypothetical protein
MSSHEPVDPMIPPATPPGGAPTPTGGPAARDSGGAAKQATESGKEAAKEVGGTARHAASDVAETAKSEARYVAVEAREHARSVATEMSEDLQMRAEEQAHRVAERLRIASGQLGALAEGRAEDAGVAGDYARDAAHRLGSVADRIDSRGIDGMADDLRDFARRRPGLFLLGAAAAGFAVGRIARSAREDQRQQDDARAYGPSAAARRETTPVVSPAGAAMVDLTGTESPRGSAMRDQPTAGYPPPQQGA